MISELLIATALTGAVAAGTAYKVTSDHYEGEIAKMQLLASQQISDANQRAANVASDYEVWQSLQKPKIVYRDRRVAAAFQAAPVWSATAVPDSVRNELSAALPESAAGSASSSMPAASAAATGNEPAASASVPGLKRFFPRVLRKTEVTGEGREAN